jgi:hypothetical protein
MFRQAKTYWEALKAGAPVDPQVQQLVNLLKENLNFRDHLFFIDNSQTMGSRAAEVQEAFSVLAYLAKLIDTDGIELAFASKPTNVHKHKDTSPLLEHFKYQRWDQIHGMFEHNLGELIDKVILPRLPSAAPSTFFLPSFIQTKTRRLSRTKKPVSIFVFTDGRFGEDLHKACGVENTIRRLMNECKERGISRTQVMIQLIRFGDNENGVRFLHYLDDFGRDEGWYVFIFYNYPFKWVS